MRGSGARVFVSYSHDSLEHVEWTARLAAGLLSRGVDVILDQWDARLGADLALFMEESVAESGRVLLVCTEQYVRKADTAVGGVGYERMIVTGELFQNLRTVKFIPVVRGVHRPPVPRFLATRRWIDFSEDARFDALLDELSAEIRGVPPSKPRLRSPAPPRSAPATGEVLSRTSQREARAPATFAERVRARAEATVKQEEEESRKEAERMERAQRVGLAYPSELMKLLDATEAAAREANANLPGHQQIRIERDAEMLTLVLGSRIHVVRHHLRPFAHDAMVAVVIRSRRTGHRPEDVEVYSRESLQLTALAMGFGWSTSVSGQGETSDRCAETLVDRLLSEAM